jgi:hypothetical protein
MSDCDGWSLVRDCGLVNVISLQRYEPVVPAVYIVDDVQRRDDVRRSPERTLLIDEDYPRPPSLHRV